MRTPESKLVWLAYLSVILAPVWGVGLPLAYFVRKQSLLKKKALISPLPKQTRDLRGALFIALVGLVLNCVVVATVLYSLVCTYFL